MTDEQNEAKQPRNRKLTKAEIKSLHKAFIKTGGSPKMTAQYTGFSISTVSRYARKLNWRRELNRHNSNGYLAEDRGSKNAEDRTMERLSSLREILFQEIIADGHKEISDESPLRIPPRTLAEAVKALIDIDKRITDRNNDRSGSMLDLYRNILQNCAEVVENEE